MTKTFDQFMTETFVPTSGPLNSKREIERYEAKLKKAGFAYSEEGATDDGFIHEWTKGKIKVEVSADVAAEGRRGMTGYVNVKGGWDD